MKSRISLIFTFILSLLLVHTTMAQTMLQQCQNRCEQTSAVQTELPECCRAKMSADPSTLHANAMPAGAENCPHAESSQGISDLVSCSTAPPRTPAPEQVFWTVSALDGQPGDGYQFRRNCSSSRSGLSPPSYTPPPPYYFFCSLLI